MTRRITSLIKRKTFLSLLTVAFCLISGKNLYAQESVVFAINSPDNSETSSKILIKWYSDHFLYDEGVNVYRKTPNTSDWSKVNDSPIVRQNSISEELKAQDEDLDFFEGIFKDATLDEVKESFIYVNVILKTIQSEAYAKFMGVYYEDLNADFGETYQYRVTRISNGQEYTIADSEPLQVGLFVAKEPVKDLEIVQEQKVVKFNWTQEEDRFYAVNIYRADGGGSDLVKLNKKPMVIPQIEDSVGNLVYPNPLYTQDSLVEGETYTYQVEGLGFFNEGLRKTEPFTISYRDVTPPGAPINLKSESDSMKVSLTWENKKNTDVRGLHIYRSRLSDGDFTRINLDYLDMDLISFEDSVLIPGPYYYKISAEDYAGNEGKSEYTFVEVADVLPPVTPQGLLIESDTGLLKLSWDKNIETDLLGYQIYRTILSDKKEEYLLLNADPIKDNFFEQDLSINVKTEFFYRIAAMDTSLNRSGLSDFASAALPDVMPPERPFVKNLTYEDKAIRIHWLPNVDEDLLGYHIYRKDTIANNAYNKLNVNPIQANAKSYLDRSCLPGVYYEYEVSAQDSIGNMSSFSKSIGGILPGLADSITVNNLMIKHNKRKKNNTINWDLENNVEVMGFVIYRGVSDNTMIPISGLIKESIFKDTSTFKDPYYYYQVRVYGNSGEAGHSNIVHWENKMNRR